MTAHQPRHGPGDRQIADAFPAPIAVVEGDGAISWVNETWTRFALDNGGNLARCGVGANYEDVCRRALDSGGPDAEDARAILEGFARLRAGGDLCFRHLYACHAPAEHRWFELCARPFGERPGRLLVAHVDVTRVKDAEERLLEREAQLVTVVNAVPVVVVSLDPEGVCTFAAGRGLDLIGRGAQDMIGRRLADIENGPTLDAAMKRVLRTGEPVAMRLRFRRAARVYDVRLVRVLDRDGEPAGVTGVALDVTEGAHLEEQLGHALRMRSLGRLAGGIAHDFNNLLTAIQGFATLAEDEPDAGPVTRDLVGEIGKAAARGAALTAQLLAVARKQVIAPEPLDVNGFLDEMLPMLRLLVGEQVELELESEPGAYPARVDRGHLQQVLLSLISNARDAISGPGRITLSTTNVEVSGDEPEVPVGVAAGAYLRLTVRDTGAGIPDEIRPNLFEPFFTTKPAGQGTGLGLATAYGTVRQHGGFFTVESAPGAGSAFHIHFPRATGPEPAAPWPAAETVRGGTETLLVVDDERLIRDVAVRTLRRLGYDVLEANDGIAALEVASASPHPIQLLVSDVVMPGMDGLLLAQEMRNRQPDLPVLLMSGHVTDAAVQAAIDARKVSFLPKPFTAAALARRVRALLDG